MSKTPIPPMAGLTEILMLLDLLANPEKYQERAAHLEGCRKDANELYRKMGVKGDVDQMLSSAKVKDQRAQERLDQAAQKAEAMVSEAEAKAAAMLEDAQSGADRIAKKAADAERAVAQRESDFRSRVEDVERREAQVKDELDSLKAQQKAASDVRNEYQAKLDILQGAISGARGGDGSSGP